MPLYMAAEVFEVTPRVGSEGRSLTAAKVERVFTPLQTAVFLLRHDDDTLLCLICSHFMTHYYRFSNLLRDAVAAELALDRERVLSFSSHNHCAVKLVREQYGFGKHERHLRLDPGELTEEGSAVLEGAVAAAGRMKDRLEPVTLRWGVGRERRITHNRKGHRADGSTYLMREDDRLELGEDFSGDIDDDAPIIGFYGEDDRPRGLLAWFTGHPVTAFDPEHPVVFGEYPQVACDVVSAACDGAPVGFLQGCAGDVNSKGLLAQKPVEESVADAYRYGQCLGESWLEALTEATPSRSEAVDVASEIVSLPFEGVPPRETLEAQIADMQSFLERCGADDEPGTRVCQGLNFPRKMSPNYRGELVRPLLRWAEWALSLHDAADRDAIPRAAEFEVASARIGDVGLVGLSCEPFDAIGRLIKSKSPTMLTLPCGYMHDTCLAYVPNAGNNGDKEYMSAFYRYTTTLLPYAQPAGDRLAEAGVNLLHSLEGAHA